MGDIEAVTVRGAVTVIPDAAVNELRQAIRGQVVVADEPGYDDSRQAWNALIDRYPAVIARCSGAADVIQAVSFARTHHLPISIRSGGHNVAGLAVCHRGVMIDLRPMRGIRVDPEQRTARAMPGVTWGQFDHETQAFGLATTGGICSETGIGGVTLGGGFGWLMRKHGLAMDNLIAFDIVTADGRLRTASARDHQELFFAVRGSQSNFGVVTSLDYCLHPVGPMVLSGMVVHPFDRAREVLGFFRDYTQSAPEDMSAWCALMTMPDGHRVIAIMACYIGSLEDGEKVAAPLRSFGPPMADMLQPMPYVKAQSLVDAAFPEGRFNYWKSSLLNEITSEVVEAVVEGFRRVTSPHSSILLEHIAGAMNRVPTEASAFGTRNAAYDCVIMPMWTNAADSESHVRWADEIWRGIQMASTGGVYVNYLGTEGPDRVRAAYGANHERLLALKRKYDPMNLFSCNQNIDPGT